MGRGTLSVHDALTNAVAKAVEYSPFESGTCHRGILKASQWLLDQVTSKMVKAAGMYPEYVLVVTGHSLGAGVAAVTTLLLEHEDGDRPRAFGFRGIQGFGFATPGIVCASVAKSATAMSCFTSLTFERDLIARLCVPKTDFLCYEVAKQSKVGEAKDIVLKWSDSSSKSYAEIKEVCAQRSSVGFESEPHYPVGRCILIAKGDDGRVSTRLAEATDFNKVILHERMLLDHMLCEYGRSLGFERFVGRQQEGDLSKSMKRVQSTCC